MSEWGEYRFCQSCSFRIYVMWHGQYVKTKWPELVQYVPLDVEMNELIPHHKEVTQHHEQAKKLEEFGF